MKEVRITRILLLEDETTIREVTTAYLEHSGYQVTAVTHGRKALQALSEMESQETPFHLAILDIMTPFVTGLQVLEEIHKKKMSTPVIMLTALNDEKTQLQAFDLYADDYVTKPFSPQLLIKRVEAVLRRYHNKDSSLPSLQKQTGLFIDRDRYNLYWHGRSLKLTLTEFLIFDLLYQYPHKTFTRTELLNSVFNDEFNINDRIIDAHIKNLRKKLPVPLIETVRGVGYAFNREVKFENRQ